MMKINTTMNIRDNESIVSIKSRRQALRYKKNMILSQLATISPSASKESRLSHPQLTSSTSIDTSGEISLHSIHDCLADRNIEEEKDYIGGVVDTSLRCSNEFVTEGIDKSLYRIQRRCMKSRRRNISKDNEETKTNRFQAKRFLDAVSDDDSEDSSVSTQVGLNFPSFRVKDDVSVQSSLGGDDKLQIPVAQLKSVPYAHGGYACAAPLMLQDSKWMRILQHLMPDAHEDLMSLLKQPDESMPSRDSNSDNRRRRSREKINWTDDPLRVMKWAENNPVVTAFGVTNSKQGKPAKVERKKQPCPGASAGSRGLNEYAKFMSKRPLGQNFRKKEQSATNPVETEDDSLETPTPRVPSIEWDVFLDPLLVKYVEQAMQQVENLGNWGDDDAIIAAEIEVDRQVSRLITRMMLAHGSTAQLFAEAIGMARGYNFSRVVKASEKVRREFGRRDWSSFPFSCGRNEDATMDETYTVPSKSILFNGKPFPSPPPRDNSERTNRPGTDARTGSVFVERWLVLFASALRLGMQNEKSIDNMVQEDKTIIPERSSDRSQRLSARFLRGSGRGVVDTNREEDIPGMDMLLQRSKTREDELFIPRPSCGLFLCLGMDDPGATSADHGKSVMAECVKMIGQILGEQLRLVLDLKSRNVPPRVWGRLIDNLRAKGLLIDGIGSFDHDELRNIKDHTSSPVTLMHFFHSAGDLQRACHAEEIKQGDTVYFNAGSLLWKKPSVCEATGINCCQEMDHTISLSHSCSDDQHNLKRGGVKFEPYAFFKEEIQRTGFTECEATLADYQQHFDLNIGMYTQEFAIGSNELNALVKLANDRPSIYNLGLAWGGLNGFATKSVQGDGFWNQRYVGRNWDTTAGPTEKMELLAPEDHHLVQKVILAGQCGQVTTAHRILDGILDDELAQNSLCESPAMPRRVPRANYLCQSNVL